MSFKKVKTQEKIMIKKSLVIILLLLLITTGCSQQNKNDETIKIGAIYPLTGFISNFGESERIVTEYAVQEINNGGGIDGKKIEVIYEDGSCNGSQALTSAQKLINANGVEIILSGCSTETLSVAPLAQEKNLLIMTAWSSSSHISKYKNVFRTIINTKENGKKLGELAKQEGLKRVVILTEQNDYPVDLRDGFMEGIGDEKKIVLEESFLLGTTNFQTQLTKIKALNPDGIFIFAIDENAGALITKQARELKIEAQLYGDIIESNPIFLEIAGASSEDIIFTDLPNVDENETLQPILNYFNKQNVEPIQNYYLSARYDSIMLLADALRKCDEDNICIGNYLKNNQHEGLLGEYGFDDNGDIVGLEIGLKQIVDGQVVNYEEK